jgi:hypothetical protein
MNDSQFESFRRELEDNLIEEYKSADAFWN